MPIHIVVASKNPGKLREIAAIMEGVPVRWHGLDEWPEYEPPPETGETFADNAVQKAVAALRATGLPALADDSGLCVEALGGAPGVRSARFAGVHGDDDANNRLLLQRLAGLGPERRRAWFYCAMALAVPDQHVLARLPVPPGVQRRDVAPGIVAWLARGRVDGIIATAPRGHGGFGYDPLFYHPPSGKTFAELAAEEKNSLSHRRRALERLRTLLAEVVEHGEGREGLSRDGA